MAKLMIVDDSKMIRKTLRMFLEAGGHEIVAEASDGEEAVENYKKFKPELVTMDISMPEMSGLEALRDIIEIDPDAKIIMISSLNQKDLVITAIKEGAQSYLLKPMSKEKTLAEIKKVLEG